VRSRKRGATYNRAARLLPVKDPIAATVGKSLILLSGNEELLRQQALRSLAEKLSEDPFDVQALDAGSEEPIAWLATASTAPFLSSARTVVVRNLLRAGSAKECFSDPVASLKSLPETARLVLVVDDELAGDFQRQQRLDGLRKGWEDAVRKAGGAVLDFKFDSAALKGELLKAAAEAGKKLDPRAAELLLDMTGRSLSRALGELEKVVLYVGGSDRIAESDVAAAAMPSREWNVFKLVDHLLEGQVGGALVQLRTLAGGPTKAEAAAMQSILPNLSRNLRMLWQARAVLEARGNLKNPSPDLQALLPKQPSLLAAPEWQQRRAMGAARRLTFGQLGECLEAVARADARLKGLEPSFSAMDVLERLVLEMSDAVRPMAKA
jgi:DNA polymerase III subunit delta